MQYPNFFDIRDCSGGRLPRQAKAGPDRLRVHRKVAGLSFLHRRGRDETSRASEAVPQPCYSDPRVAGDVGPRRIPLSSTSGSPVWYFACAREPDIAPARTVARGCGNNRGHRRVNTEPDRQRACASAPGKLVTRGTEPQGRGVGSSAQGLRVCLEMGKPRTRPLTNRRGVRGALASHLFISSSTVFRVRLGLSSTATTQDP